MFISFLALLLALSVAPAPSVATGHWEGFMRRGASELAVRFDLRAGPPSEGVFSAPDLGAIDIPLSRIKLGRLVHWELVGDMTTTVFDATIKGDAMTGTFRENELAGVITLRRTSESVAKPYATEPVAFANGAVRLAGTLFVPRSAGRHPAVVLVHGSGPEGRWATAYIADDLARRGIVALTYDKRGVGASTGDWRASTMEDLIADARAAVHLVAQRSDVDPNRVGVYGHSQGGELAPAIAKNNSEVKWIAAADGPVGPQYRQDLFRVNTALAKRYSGQSLADSEKLYAEFVEVARTGAAHTQLRADVRAAGTAAWLDFLAIPDDTNWIWNWYRTSGNYDNSAAWATVTVPVLLLFGADDALVPPQESIEGNRSHPEGA
jgi:pimeloyl-ACP methyl ester carboxylesterase